MNLLRLGPLLCLLAISPGVRGGESAPAAEAWQPLTWNGERSFAAESRGWTAIVSIDRDRLVYLGSADRRHNLLFVAASRGDPANGGGHRVWLGPQTTWGSGGWPPPAAWEASGAERVERHGGRLELFAPDAGGGWPRVIRVYAWSGGRLHCTVRIRGGTRAAQIIQILQVPRDALVTARATPGATAPFGYTLVHLGRHPSPQYRFAPPPQVAQTGAALEIRFTGRSEKLGLPPQTLVARLGADVLRVARGAASGAVASTPDDGFVTQVYLGDGHSPLIELEQLSPAWKPGTEASFDMVVEPGAGAAP